MVVHITGVCAADSTAAYLTRRKIYSSFLAEVGESTELAIDASEASQDFYIASTAGKIIVIDTIKFLMQGKNLELDTKYSKGFGEGHLAEVTNGVSCWADWNGTQSDILLSPAKSLCCFLAYADEFINIKKGVSSTDDFLSFVFNLKTPIILHPTYSHKLIVRINDDFSDLVCFKVLARGYTEVIS